MSNIFLAYRFTGENHEELGKILGNIRDSLQNAGHTVFCTFWLEDYFREMNFSLDQRYEYGLKKIDESDIFLAFVKSPHSSKGMVMESGRAVERKKRYVLAIKKGLDFPKFRSAAHQIIEYGEFSELYSKLKGIQ